MNDLDYMDVDSIVPIRNGANVTLRPSISDIFQEDAEYAKMEEHIKLPEDATKNLDEEVKTTCNLNSVGNVLGIVYLDVQGYSSDDISKAVGISTKDLAKVRASDPYNIVKTSLLREIVNTSERVLKASSMKAVKTIVECMNSGNDKIRLAAAKEVLDRIGLVSSQKIELTTSVNDVESLSDAELREILREAGTIVTDEIEMAEAVDNAKEAEVVDVDSK